MDRDFVNTKRDAAQRSAMSLRQFDRIIAAGEGPAVVELGPRRRGILESDLQTWLASRRRPARRAQHHHNGDSAEF